ncbi:hypothetical protein E1B28_005939 [Marasmius oreades]|uniref:Uncharacterized protein n=1 Tax=Marasmius oreades TaxID=181124 RepID=A0A9P7S4J6_9AGAR|nr:uncharacterized protein E1B28_005939 [Marasmius oreades]KAG7095160.1 hypothetical protein E1B28_005939 [Marasmius oreades]
MNTQTNSDQHPMVQHGPDVTTPHHSQGPNTHPGQPRMYMQAEMDMVLQRLAILEAVNMQPMVASTEDIERAWELA